MPQEHKSHATVYMPTFYPSKEHDHGQTRIATGKFLSNNHVDAMFLAPRALMPLAGCPYEGFDPELIH